MNQFHQNYAQEAHPLPMVSVDQIVSIEMKLAFLEEALEQLDAVVIRQQTQIDALIGELVALKQSSTDGGLAAPRNLRDDLPPHF